MTTKPSEPAFLTSVYERPDRELLLYKLLSERDAATNISHRELPKYYHHVKFVESHPYAHWYFIGPEPFGACYLTRQDEIGIHIFKAHQGQGYGRRAVEALMQMHGERRYLANINPNNDRSRDFFHKLGFNLCQVTYERLPSRS